jgi:hypothetical protein
LRRAVFRVGPADFGRPDARAFPVLGGHWKVPTSEKVTFSYFVIFREKRRGIVATKGVGREPG